jgi:pimeloyl-ACP methyl ester carboxylesterase
MISNRPEIHDRVAREWARIFDERPIGRETFTKQLFAAGRYVPPNETPDVPLLLLNSLSDRMVHPSCSEAIADRWRCELRRHPTAGHDLTLDAGPWVTQAIDGWLKDSFECRARKHATGSAPASG